MAAGPIAGEVRRARRLDAQISTPYDAPASSSGCALRGIGVRAVDVAALIRHALERRVAIGGCVGRVDLDALPADVKVSRSLTAFLSLHGRAILVVRRAS